MNREIEPERADKIGVQLNDILVIVNKVDILYIQLLFVTFHGIWGYYFYTRAHDETYYGRFNHFITQRAKIVYF